MSIDADEFRQLALEFKSKTNGCVFGMKVTLWVLLTIWGVEAALSSSWPIAVAGTLLTGLMFAHGVELQHQALHNTGFQSRLLNEIAGIALGAPMLVSFALYQVSHLRHHRHLGTPKNHEFFEYGDQYGRGGLSAVRHVFLRFSMIQHYWGFLAGTARALLIRRFPGETAPVSRRIRRDHLVMLGALLAVGAISHFLGGKFLLYGWLLPLLLVAAPVHALIELPEHYRCDTDSTDSFRNSRSIRSTPFLTWFTNGNNLHVEHHLLPGLPIERLHELHERIAPRIKYLCPTYVSFLAEVIFGRARGTFTEPTDAVA